jgi:hypothetical protein
MNFKTTYLLFGILFLVLGTFLITQLFGTRTADKQLYVLPSLHDVTDPVVAKDIDRVEIARTRPKEETLMFYRGDQNHWRLKQPATHAADMEVDRIITQIMGAKRDEQADIVPDLAKFGLDNPAETVTLYRKGSDREWKINLGNSSSGEDKGVVYVTSSDSPKEPAAVRRGDLDALFKNVNEFRSKVLLAESAFDPIEQIKIQEPKHEAVALEKTTGNKWRFQKPAFGEADYEGEPPPPGVAAGPQKITGVRELLQAVADLRVESDADFADNDAGDADLSSKGLESEKQAEIRIELKKQPIASGDEKPEPVVDALLIGKKVDDKSDKVYARLESERNVVKIPAKKVDGLRAVVEHPGALRNRDLVDAEISHIDALNIKLGEQETVKLRKTGTPAAWKVYDGKRKDAESATVSTLLTLLTNKRQVKDFPEAGKTDAELGLDKPATVVSLWVDGLKKEKKEESADEKPKEEKAGTNEKKDEIAEPALKDEKPTVKLVFGKKDKDIVYVRREAGAETMRLAVPASLLEKVAEPKLAYLERKLPSFGPASEVNKLTLIRGSETEEIDRLKDDKSTSWKIVQPKGRAGRTADTSKVERMVSALSNLQAEKLVAEKASDQELTRFGLKSPPVKVTVTLAKPDKKTEDFVFLFGNETEDKANVYAKQGNHDLVFLVRKNLLDDFTGDVQEQTVLHFDVNKLKAVKLTGWQDVVGSPVTLDLERKASQIWIVKGPSDFKLDPAKLESFVAGLTDLKAQRFIGKGLKPEYKLDVKQGGFEISLTMDGEKEPTTLIVGAATGESVYAQSNKLQDEVFTLPKALFEQARTKPAYFKKD